MNIVGLTSLKHLCRILSAHAEIVRWHRGKPIKPQGWHAHGAHVHEAREQCPEVVQRFD